MKPNLLIFTPLAFENGRGGEISAMELAVGLQKYYKITLLDSNIIIGKKILASDAIKKKLKGLERSDKIKFAILKFFDKIFTVPYPWEILKLYRYIKKNDIIYTSALTIKTNLLFILFSLLHRKGQFVVGHRKPLYSDKLFSLYNLKLRTSILLFSIFKKRFHHHTISNHARNFLKTFFSPEKITHIIHGIDLENFSKAISKEREIDKLKFIYVGYLDDVHKGIGILLDAIKDLLQNTQNYNISFEFCGTGPMKERIEKLQTEFPQFIKYHGYVSNNIIHEYYQNCDVFLFTSRREPFGRVLIEALASKLLIICTKTYGSIEVLRGKEFAFFLDELDKHSIINKIDLLYKMWEENPSEIDQLKQLAKEYAFKKYSIVIELKMFRKLFEDLRLGRA